MTHFIVALLVGTAAWAQNVRLPDNLTSADTCRYGLSDARLSCRDQRGNKLIENFRLYDRQWFVAYDELLVMSLMRGEGFTPGPRVEYRGDKVYLYFVRNGSGSGIEAKAFESP